MSPFDRDHNVENPNAVGLFGHHYHDAPAAVEVEDHDAQHLAHHDHHSAWHPSLYNRWQDQQPSDPIRVAPHQQSVGLALSPDPQPPQRHAAHFYAQEDPSHSHVDLGHPHDMSQQYFERYGEAETPLVGNAAQHAGDESSSLGRKPSQRGANASAFDLVHGAKGSHIAQHGEQIPIRLKHLFKRPLIRQWILQDKLYREVDERAPSQFELFFDLVMVGIIHKLADGAAEDATALNVAKFVLVFYPAWSVWSDVRSYINVSGTDDVWQRLYILLIMLLLTGYAANATGIIIKEANEHGGSSAESEGGSHAVRTAVHLLRRASSEAGPETEPELVSQIGDTGFWFASGYHAAIASAIGFYLVAKFCRLALYFVYGLLLPKFRKALWLNMTMLIVISCVYLPVMFITSPGVIVIFICCGMLLELFSRYIVAAAMQFLHGQAKHRGHKTYMPAYSLPHMMERMTQFTILVVGESIMNATYVAFSGEYGPQDMFGRAALTIVIAMWIMWLYFDIDSSRTFVHALKRHWFTSISFTNLHFPLCASLILMSSSLVKIIQQEAIEVDYLWFFSGSIATVMLCMGIIGMLHKSLDVWGSALIPKSARIALRFILAAVFAIMPLLRHWTGIEFLAVHAGLLALAVAFETFGKLHAVGREYDPVRAEELRRLRREISEGRSPSIPLSRLEKSQHHRSIIGNHMATAIEVGKRKLHKDSFVKGPGRRASWHEYDDLTGAERGEEDVGIESELGKIESKDVSSGERWAYVGM